MKLRLFVLATALTSMSGLAGLAAAQTDAVRAIYESSAVLTTNVEGIRTFPAPPEGFNALTAADEELAAYGLPPRPDPTEDAGGYAAWAKAMSVNPRRWNGELTPRRAQSSVARAVSTKSSPHTINTATAVTTSNWSGVVNTLPLSAYSATKSFYYVVADFNIPIAKQAFNGSGGTICDGGWDIASVWVGLDGLNEADVLQGGIDSAYYCDSSTHEQSYEAWIEWFPNGSKNVFGVSQGDDFYVEVWNTSATQGYVYLEDVDLQKSATYSLTAPKGITLQGNQAEYIVERPSGDSLTNNGFYPLANYIWDFWDFAHAKTHNSVYYDPGSTSAATYDVTMTDDGGTDISFPTVGTTGYQGLYSIWFQDENCARTSGCTP
jgi:hypothetical protein